MRPVRINYKNGVGDVAVWDAQYPEDEPRTSQARKDENVYYDNCTEVRAAGKAPIPTRRSGLWTPLGRRRRWHGV